MSALHNCNRTPLQIIAFIFAGLLLFTFNSCGGNSQYDKDVKDFRAMKNESFTNTTSSPLSKKELIDFKGLSYFEVDQTYKLQAKFIAAAIPKYISLFESDDVKQIHVVRGNLHFKINNTNCSLLAYSSAGQAHHSLFIPFSDTHKNSYPGGRYVDAKLINDSTCTLDFNLSYNPYCVYNEKYKCAIVPESNRLEIEIPAGERWKQINKSDPQ
jgi:uncharacterized protein (DUF1684 family)